MKQTLLNKQILNRKRQRISQNKEFIRDNLGDSLKVSFLYFGSLLLCICIGYIGLLWYLPVHVSMDTGNKVLKAYMDGFIIFRNSVFHYSLFLIIAEIVTYAYFRYSLNGKMTFYSISKRDQYGLKRFGLVVFILLLTAIVVFGGSSI